MVKKQPCAHVTARGGQTSSSMEVSSTNTTSVTSLSYPLVPSHSLPPFSSRPRNWDLVCRRKLQKVEMQPCAHVTARGGQPTSSMEVRSYSPLSPASHACQCPPTPYPSSPAQELGLGVRAEASDGQEAAMRTRHSTRRPNQLERGGELYQHNLCHQPLLPPCTLTLLTPFLFPAQELGLGVQAEASEGRDAALRTRPSTRRPAHLEHGGELYQPLSPQPLMPPCTLPLLTPPPRPRNWVLVCGRKLQMVEMQPCAHVPARGGQTSSSVEVSSTNLSRPSLPCLPVPSHSLPPLSPAQELGLGVRAEASDGQEAAQRTRPSTRRPTQLERGGELYQPLSP
jgi:hypothetical protein